MNLDDLESLIEFTARRYSNTPDDFDEKAQIGRIVAWQILEKDSNISKNYIKISIENTFKNQFKFENTQKRKPTGGFISLQEELGEDIYLEDTIGISDEISFEIDLVNSLKINLLKKYGKNWIKSISKEKNSKKICDNIVRTVIEDIANIPLEEIPNTVTNSFFEEYGILNLIWAFYGDYHSALISVYKDHFVPWDFNKVPRNYWKGSKGIKRSKIALEWFLKKYDISDENSCKKIKFKHFKESNLVGMLNSQFSGNSYLALKSVFPNLRTWDTGNKKSIYFNSKENRKIAILDYLISEGIGDISNFSTEEIHDTKFKDLANKKNLAEKGYRTLVKYYNGNIYNLFNENFPQVKPWSIKGLREPYKDNPHQVASDATKWLFEKYLGVEVQEIPKYASVNLLRNQGFSGLLTMRSLGFSNSPYKLIDNAYPNLFSESDFKRSRKIIKI